MHGAPGEAFAGDTQEALRTAFAPVHLSALPLCGAWWTGTRFSAALEAYFPADTENAPDTARCTLENDSGEALAEVNIPLRRAGYAGVIDAQLPDTPCVLTLHCALMRGDKTLESSELPVYVGERGPLEAAF